MGSLLPIALVLGGLFLFKDQIMEVLNDVKGDLNLGGSEESLTDPNTTHNQNLQNGQSDKTVAIDYYAGKIAVATTRMAADNIYDATRIKEEIINSFILDVQRLAQIQQYRTDEPIMPGNVFALRLFALIVLKTVNVLRIRLTQKNLVTIQVLSGNPAGYTQMNPPLDNAIISNMYLYLAELFNNAPPLIDQGIQKDTTNDDIDDKDDDKDKDDDDKKKKDDDDDED